MPPRSDAAWDRVQARGLSQSSGVGLSDAVQALSRALDQAWLDAQQQGLHFVVEPVELTVHVTPLRHVSGEIEWRVLRVDEQTSPQPSLTHTLTMRFLPHPMQDKPDEGGEDE
jgi:hypothetical protein